MRQLENKTIEITQFDEQEEKRMKKNEEILRDLWDTINHTIPP